MTVFSKTYQLPFSIKETYQNWISNDTVVEPAERMDIQPEIGGRYQLVMPGGITMLGTFTEVVPNEKLAYSWHWQGDEETTMVQVTFNKTGKAAEHTLIRITHGDFSTEEAYNNHASGWDGYIKGFTELLQSRKI